MSDDGNKKPFSLACPITSFSLSSCKGIFIDVGCKKNPDGMGDLFFNIDFSIFGAEKEMNLTSLHNTYYYWTLPDGTV